MSKLQKSLKGTMASIVPGSLALRKAAILISTLDTRSADALLDKMPSETAAAVRDMVMELDEISPDEQNEVIREFMKAGGQVSDQELDSVELDSVNLSREDLDGVELDPSLVEKLHSPTGYQEHREAFVSFASPPPFQFLRDATTEVLVRHLERQRPQLIAMVVSHLPARQAADVIKRFNPKLQADVLRRVAELDVTDQEVLRDVERELELLLQDDLRLARNRQQGLATVSTILHAAGQERQTLLESLSAHQFDLAAELHNTLEQSNQPPAARASSAHRDSVASPPSVRRAEGMERPVRRLSKADPMALVESPTDEEEADELLPAARRSEPALMSIPVQQFRAQETFGRASGGVGRPAPNIGESPQTEKGLDRSTASPQVPYIQAQEPEIAFEDLAQLGDEDWALLIRAVEPQVVLLALTGASEPLLRSMTKRLSKREAQALHKRLQQTGPLRLSDIEQAQRHMARHASRLIAGGRIRLPSRRTFAAAA